MHSWVRRDRTQKPRKQSEGLWFLFTLSDMKKLKQLAKTTKPADCAVNCFHKENKMVMGASFQHVDRVHRKDSFPLRAWNGVFFVCFIDFFFALPCARLHFKRRKINRRKKECSIPDS